VTLLGPRASGAGLLRITTRMSVRERVRPFDKYLLLGCSGARPSSTPFAHGVEVGLAGIDIGEIEPAHVADREFAEHIVEDRGGVFDRVAALHWPRGFEAGEGEGVDIYCKPSGTAMAKLLMKAPGS
jgi:hypothetical protein